MRAPAAAALAVVVLVAAGAPAHAVDPLRDRQPGLDRIQAERAWVRGRGAGVAIAILDTGVDMQHEDLRAKLLPGHDFVDNDDAPQDRNGHGTHVAGVAAAATGNGVGIDGVAPDAMIMPLRVLDAEGTGVESNVEAAVNWALLQASSRGMKLVINMSFTDLERSANVSSRRIQEAVRRAWFAGAVIVAATGNDRLPLANYPAAGPNVLAVGATDVGDQRAPFSNQGATVVAPGVDIVSTYWDPATPNDHSLYAKGSGTSMAAPFVSGVAALLLSAGMDNRQTVDQIVRTADDLGPHGYDGEFGYGRVNAARAMGLPELTGGPSGLVPANETDPGRFEVLASPGAAAVVRDLPKRRPAKTVPLAVALVLAGVAYAAARTGSGLGAERRRTDAGRPWES